MKLSKFVKRAKSESYCVVIHADDSSIWLGTRLALYNATELPYMEGKEQAGAVLDIDSKAWEKMFFDEKYTAHAGADFGMNLTETDPTEQEARRVPLEMFYKGMGLVEYPEIQKFVKYFAKWLERQYEIPVDLKVLTPELTFPEVLTKYGYPVIGKEVAKVIYYARHGSQWALNRLDGLDKRGKPSKFKERYKKYKFMVEAPFSTSQLCCDVMKKGPAKKYEKETGRKPIVATMTEESEQRQASWLRYGCNSFDSERPMSKPMSFWTEQDVLQYLKQTGIPYAPVYGEIVEENMQLQMFDEEFPPKLTTTGCDRTGCMYCMFGIMSDKEPNRFQRMKQTHPAQYKYCIYGGHFENGELKPDKTGLGLGKILDYIGKPY